MLFVCCGDEQVERQRSGVLVYSDVVRVGSRWEKPGEVAVCTPREMNYSQNRTHVHE